MAKIRPEGFEPPYPAWSPVLPEGLSYVQAQVAIQSPSGRRDDALFESLAARLRGDGGLRHVERVGHVDGRGAYNDIAIGYWKTPDAMRAWLAPDGPFGSFADVASESGCGAWYEAIVAPRSHYEINASTPDLAWGLAIEFDCELEPYHAYWGSMRDRIAAAEDGGLPGTVGSVARVAREGRTQVRIELPEHICLIRTVQGLSDTADEEAAAYRSDMKPQYEAGVEYLASHPMHSRCLSARLVSYDRLAFQGGQADPGLRVPFDTNLKGRAHDLSLLSTGYAQNRFFAPPQWCIMEIKADGHVPLSLQGQVKWRAEAPEGFAHGLAFGDLHDDERGQLETLLGGPQVAFRGSPA